LDIDGEIIQCTETHPFQVKGKGWVDACNLIPGDIVYTKDWNTATVRSVNLLELPKPVEVFNFEVEDCHTYFVGELGVLVHNECVAKDGDYKAIVNELKEMEAPHAHILKNGTRIAKVDINGNIIKGTKNKGVMHFVSKYKKDIINGIKEYYPKL
jgi:intein/homing endonuclease